MLRKILIANRGEIVARVARTARRMGLASVAVYADSDIGAPHRSVCDEAEAIGGRTPSESYLRGEAILEAARRAGADAIHPGYGFLSENASFAAAVEAAGLRWIGPSPDAIESMGDKARARVRVAAMGAPVTPGYDGADQSAARFEKEAAGIGYPVMIKAAAGGGGRGMRRVESAEALREALKSAAQEAKKAFGDGRLILEKAIEAPRHVEVQVFADQYGACVHLGERDCSVQRRHQKVIEEAPSPAVDAELRARLGACAVSIAREIGYRGAGTVEFLLDRAGAFYFMEMNTRLQVEHPVTEAITDVDLVEWQIRVARGEPLPLKQEDIRFDGWAMEARLCAEEPAEDYAPRSGRVAAWRKPSRARCDHAIAEGAEVSSFFDSMLAKVIVYGRDRKEACAALGEALRETTLLGVASNKLLLQRIAAHPAFQDGGAVSTAFLAEHFAPPAARGAAPDAAAWAIAAWISAAATSERSRVPETWRDWTSTGAASAPWRLAHVFAGEESEKRGTVLLGPGNADVMGVSADPIRIEGAITNAGQAFDLTVGGAPVRAFYCWREDELWLEVKASGDESRDFLFDNRRLRARVRHDVGGDQRICSPLAGRVHAVSVAPGAAVARDQVVAVVEAMKMEHTIRAGRDGVIGAVHVRAGDQVRMRQVLVELE